MADTQSTPKVVFQSAGGQYSLSDIKRSDIDNIAITDIDLLITLKTGQQILLVGAGLAATERAIPMVGLADGSVSSAVLLKLTDTNVKPAMALDDSHTDGTVVHAPKPIEPPAETHKYDNAQGGVSALNNEGVVSVEKLAANVVKIVENMHSTDNAYVAPHVFDAPPIAPPPPAGVPAPISMTPIVTLFMGNVVGTTSSMTANPGYVTYYGGGGADGSDALAGIGPRNALQFSAATIDTTATAGNVIVYAQGPLVGNLSPETTGHTAYYTKQFSLNVAGYFTSLEDVKISGVPDSMTIVGATSTGNGNWTLASDTVVKGGTFTITYPTTATGTVDIVMEVAGMTTKHANFDLKENFRFQFTNVKDVSQVTDSSLAYSVDGYSREIYVLPTLDQPNNILAGDGNDQIYGSRSNDTITIGNGNNLIVDGSGNNTMTVGNGNNTITSGDGTNQITIGSGSNSITLGNGANNTIVASDIASSVNTITVGSGAGLNLTLAAGTNTVSTQGGGGTIHIGGGTNANVVNVLNTAAGSAEVYSITIGGTGANTITGSDDNYRISLGNTAATNRVTLGASTAKGNGVDTFDTSIATGSGASVINVGAGEHSISVGAGVTAITVGGNSSNLITTVGGGGSIDSNGGGFNKLVMTSAANASDRYTIHLNGTGSSVIQGGDDNYTINLGSTTGTHKVTLGASTSNADGVTAFDTSIIAGSGSSTITVGAGVHNISVGAGATNISVGGDSNNLITTAGGGGTISSNGNGTNTVNINSTTKSTDTYTVNLLGTGNETVTAGDDVYTITMGGAASSIHTVTLGDGTSNQNSSANAAGVYDTNITLGMGTSHVAVGGGEHNISVGTGSTTISIGGYSNNKVTTAGGGGTITSTGDGDNKVVVNSANNEALLYTIALTGAGNNTIVAGDDNYLVNMGGVASSVHNVTLGNSTHSDDGVSTFDTNVVLGAGSNTVSVGAGEHKISVGAGAANITVLGDSNNQINTSGGGAARIVSNGNGNNTVNINSTHATYFGYTISLAGSGSNTIDHTSAAADGNYAITLGNTTGTNNVNIGDSTAQQNGVSNFDTTIVAGTGNSVISVGQGEHSITVGYGTTQISFAGNSSNVITANGAANLSSSTITGSGNGTNLVKINSGTGSTSALYNINLNGTGANTIVAGNDNYAISLGNSTVANTVTLGNSTAAQDGTTNFDTTIVAGDATNKITVGSGTHRIAVGLGASTITIGGNENNLVTAVGGSGTIVSTGNGNNTVNVNTAAMVGNVASNYTINLTGTGNNTVGYASGTGDGDYTISLGNTTGVNTVNLGKSTSLQNGTTLFDTTIVTGTGTSNIVVGAGVHSIAVGAGVTSISISGDGNNMVTTNGDGGTIVAAGAGNDAVYINSTLGSRDRYVIGLNGVGNHSINHSGAGTADDDYTITLGDTTGANSVTLGNSSSTGDGVTTFATTITAGNGASNINVGTGTHGISVGTGSTNVSVAGNDNNTITAVGGTGVITSNGNGNNIININTPALVGNVASFYNISLLGTGSNIVQHSSGNGDANYSIRFGNTTGTNKVRIGDSTSLQNGTTLFDTTIIAGTGTSDIAVGAGMHSISVGAGATTISVGGDSNNLVTTSGGGAASITSTGNGNNKVYVNSALNSSYAYTISLTGTGSNTIAHNVTNTGDGNYAITLGNTLGVNSVTLANSSNTGDGVSTFATTISSGSGANNIAVGGGTHGISVGFGASTVTVGGNENNTVTLLGGSGTITSNGNGNNTVNVNTTALVGNSASTYSISMTGTGSNVVNHSNAAGITGDGNYTIQLGNTLGTNTVRVGASTSLQNGNTQFDTTIVAGTGTSNISVGAGLHSITVGAGATTIGFAGDSNNVVTTSGGGVASISSAGNGNNKVYINSALGSSYAYTVALTGTGSNTISHNIANTGDGNYSISLGNTVGTNSVTLANSANTGDGVTTFASTITSGSGNNVIAVGSGTHSIAVGTGTSTITVGGNENNTITAVGGTGTIVSSGNGNNLVNINTPVLLGNAASNYTITMLVTGSNAVNHSNAVGVTGDANYTIQLGNTVGTNTVRVGNSTALQNGISQFDTTIVTGTGTSNINVGTGLHSISVGAGATTISFAGDSNNVITTAGGGNGSVTSAGNGNNKLYINGAANSSYLYTIALTGTGSNTIASNVANTGDGNYNITLGNTSGLNKVTLGNSTNVGNGTSSFDSTIIAGTGASNIAVGAGVHSITVGGATTIATTGTGNNTIVATSGGGSISTSQGNQLIKINQANAAPGTDTYTVVTNGNGTTTMNSGNDNYNLTLGSGANNITIGNGNSTIAATGAGVDTIVTGTGVMGITTGNANGNSISVGGGSGTITNGNGNSSSINVVGAGSFTINTGNGAGDTVLTHDVLGNINNINVGTGGTSSSRNTISVGSGTDNIYVGTGFNTINGGGDGSSLYFWNTGAYNKITNSALNITFNGASSGTATGTSIGDNFTGIRTIYGTNLGDTINMALNSAAATIYAGSGNDTITLGTGVDTVYAGNGNNIIAGSNITAAATNNFLYGGTGNTTFTANNAGTTYNGTNGTSFATIANNPVIVNGGSFTATVTAATDPFANSTTPAFLSHTFAAGAATLGLTVNTQLATLNYYTSPAVTTVNLLSGAGSGSAAQGSFYTFNSNGFSSINEVIGSAVTNNWSYFYPSYGNVVFVNDYAGVVDDRATVSNAQSIIIVGNGLAAGGVVYQTQINFGLAAETYVPGGKALYGPIFYYNNSQSETALNFDSVAHTLGKTSTGISSSLVTTDVNVAAYSGANWGANGINIAGSWSTGDFFAPAIGTSVSWTQNSGWNISTNYMQLQGSQTYGNIVFGGSSMIQYWGTNTGNLAAGYTDYFYAGSGGSVYMGQAGNHVAVTTGATGTNIYQMNGLTYTVLNSLLDTGLQQVKDLAFAPGGKVTFAGTQYTEFSYGYGGTNAPSTTNNYGVTYLAGYENVVGTNNGDYFVGDNNGNQINLLGGANTIILGKGTNIIDVGFGTNTITSSSAVGQTVGINTLNFQTNNGQFSGILHDGWNTANTYAYVFLNYTSTVGGSTFFQGINDQSAVEGAAYNSSQQVLNGNGYDTVAAGIISTINGSNYASYNATLSPSALNATYLFDSIYSGAQIIRGNPGNNVYLDTAIATGTFANPTTYGSEDIYFSSRNNVVYATAGELATLHIHSALSQTDVLRVEGWGASNSTSNAFLIGLADPFTSTFQSADNSLELINATYGAGGVANTGVNVLDVRSSADTVDSVTHTISFSPTSTANATPTYNLSSSDIFYLSGASTATPVNNPILYLKLDTGEHFIPVNVGASTGANSAIWSNAVNSGGAGNYYSGNTAFYSGTTHDAAHELFNSVATGNTIKFYLGSTQSTLIATDVHNTTVGAYITDVFSYVPLNTHTATLQIHYGAG